MRRLWAIVLLGSYWTCGCLAQKGALGTGTTSNSVDGQRVPVYTVTSGVTPPELIPTAFPEISPHGCKTKTKGKVEVAAIVDADGQPRDLWFLHPAGNDLDRLALRYLEHEQFKPGMRNGEAVAVGQAVALTMEACYFSTEASDGGNKLSFRMLTEPQQKLRPLPNAPVSFVWVRGDAGKGFESEGRRPRKPGDGVTEPRLIFAPEAEFSEEARRANVEAVSVISLVVDEQGMPQNIHLSRAAGLGLDENAAEAVSRYRFRPAMHNGEPVPVPISVEVRFRLRR